MGEATAFSYRERKDGAVEITHHGRVASTLRGARARAVLQQLARADAAAAQHLMARITGQYRRGNERAAPSHPRNRSGSTA